MTDHDDNNPRAPVPGHDGKVTPRGHRSSTPVGRTARFIELVRAAHGDAFARSWLGAACCQFEDCVVWTDDTGRSKINRVCGDQIRAANVVIRSDDEARAHLRAAVAHLGAYRPKPMRRFKRKSQ